MSDEIRWLPKMCEQCGEPFGREIGSQEKYCPKHRRIPLVTYGQVSGSKRNAMHIKEMAWSEISRYLQ